MTKRRKKPPIVAGPTSPRLSVTVSCPVHRSFRVEQVAGMFDVPLAKKSERTFDVELPAREELIEGKPWQIGVIVGPSGSGKSTIARQAFGEQLYESRPGDWPADRAVIDCFPEAASIRDVTALFTSVGLGSAPTWIRPYQVLSNGERFRCDLARALLTAAAPCNCGRAHGTEAVHRAECSAHQATPVVAFDEFTSVVDRTVAKTGSIAISKHVRKENAAGHPLQFVAVTCHYDIVEWLEPDWVLDMASCQLARGRLQRPKLHLEIFRTGRAAWRLFSPHHYLSASVQSAARFFVGLVEGAPAALIVVGNCFGRYTPPRGFAGVRQISRVVVLPDFQGIGIGGRMLAAVCELLAGEGLQARITTGMPPMIRALARDPRWRITRASKAQNRRRATTAQGAAELATRGNVLATSAGRMTVSARWIGTAQIAENAQV